MKKEFQVILCGSDARALLNKGFPIYDIRQKKEAPRETVFIFKNTEEFQKEFQKMSKK